MFGSAKSLIKWCCLLVFTCVIVSERLCCAITMLLTGKKVRIKLLVGTFTSLPLDRWGKFSRGIVLLIELVIFFVAFLIPTFDCCLFWLSSNYTSVQFMSQRTHTRKSRILVQIAVCRANQLQILWQLLWGLCCHASCIELRPFFWFGKKVSEGNKAFGWWLILRQAYQIVHTALFLIIMRHLVWRL